MILNQGGENSMAFNVRDTKTEYSCEIGQIQVKNPYLAFLSWGRKLDMMVQVQVQVRD